MQHSTKNGHSALIACLLISTFVSHQAIADAFKCKGSNGKVVISSSPCEDSSAALSVQRSENISAQQRQNALNELERQKQYLSNLDREREANSRQHVPTSNPHQGTGDSYDPDTRDRIHACLMKITATTGISSYEIGRRKVGCYGGTRGLLDECEGRITATSGLTTQQEQGLRAQCRSVTGG